MLVLLGIILAAVEGAFVSTTSLDWVRLGGCFGLTVSSLVLNYLELAIPPILVLFKDFRG